MWSTNTYWFDVAIAATVLAFGHLAFGRFEEHRPWWRRTLKLVASLALFVGVSVFAGREWLYTLLGVTAVFVLAVHGWWLPKHGVNGWTAEPRERYYALRGLGPDGRPLR